MKGKYSSLPQFVAAYGKRQLLRRRLRDSVAWRALDRPEPGCTAILGVCHRLPDVLLGNLRCLLGAGWPELAEIILVVDGERGCLPRQVEQGALGLDGKRKLRIEYYTAAQARLSESLRLPWVFAWMSWTIGFAQCVTRHALIHDYDALVFGDSMARRYRKFVADEACIQGICWYEGNGVTAEDHLSTTFEAFVDVAWIRSRPPIAALHRIRYSHGRTIDYDILLDLQHNFTSPDRCTIAPMGEEEIVHPSQMIHQYTMFRRFPGRELPCYSIPMIPFFEYLSGNGAAIAEATSRLDEEQGRIVDWIGDGTRVHVGALVTEQVDWALKQMVRACVRTGIAPFADLYRYGERLYALCSTPSTAVWAGDFTPEQREWISRSRDMGRG